MPISFRIAGQQAALLKLGMTLSFPSEDAARKHYETRHAVGQVTGAAGTLGGAALGGLAGGKVHGLPGALVGAMAGGYLGNRALSAPSKVMYDVAHDLPQKYDQQLEDTRIKMDVSSGLPSGVYQ